MNRFTPLHLAIAICVGLLLFLIFVGLSGTIGESNQTETSANTTTVQ